MRNDARSPSTPRSPQRITCEETPHGDVARDPDALAGAPAHVPTLEDWVSARVETLGVEGGDDVAMLSPKDFELPDIPFHVRAYLDKEYPRVVKVGDATYEADYALRERQVTLHGARLSPRAAAAGVLAQARGACG